MEFLILFLLMWCSITNAASLPRQSNDRCCFHLASVGLVNETVLESHIGTLLLGGTFQQGGFCLDKTTNTIQDGLKHGCFMRDPGQQFECYAGLTGPTSFHHSPPTSDGTVYLTYDDGPGVYFACPAGKGVDQTYNIFSTAKTDTTGCLPVALALQDQTDACSADIAPVSTVDASVTESAPPVRRSSQAVAVQPTVTTNSGATFTSMTRAGVVMNVTQSSSMGPPRTRTTTSSSSSHPTAPSRTCSIDPAASSIAPMRIGYPDPSTPGNFRDTNAEAAISPFNTTFFEYTVPKSFLRPIESPNVPLCALQFRMPICMSLPEGYPCYYFSGLEQEFLANSGMAFNLTLDDGLAEWNNTALHQVTPGENSTLGVFECGKVAGGYASDRKMTWQVNSIRNFTLEFLHAGVGQKPEFQDGVGAWIVPCS
ncbi:hypothetical protein F4778DRAFT_595456 [Xylariomycetidae sp. FL2044]|nr:hypothetical protein F4778DRAFT_595456 [Xylariomycetidae sp. FL2044]